MPQALKGCEDLPTHRESCYSGVFMENVVGAIAKDERKTATNSADFHITSYLSDDPKYPCNAVKKRYQRTCYFFQTSRMVELVAYNFKRVAKICQSIEKENQTYCFLSMGRDASNFFGKDSNGIERACMDN